jgi:hypothetical protein
MQARRPDFTVALSSAVRVQKQSITVRVDEVEWS